MAWRRRGAHERLTVAAGAAKYDDLAHERDLLETNIKDLEEQLRETQEREDDMLDRMKELTSEGEVSRALIGKLEDEVRLLVDSENSLKTVRGGAHAAFALAFALARRLTCARSPA